MNYLFDLYFSKIIENVRNRIIQLRLEKPRLDVLRTSDRSDSDSYIRRKKKVLEGAGIEFHVHDVSKHDKTALLAIINEMNCNPKVHGILVQFPLGDHLQKLVKSEELMELVDWRKDVDGFHPLNMLHSMTRTSSKLAPHFYESCTPKAVMRLLREMEINIKGLDVVLIGKSRVVGLPLLHQLLNEGATVQVCHKNTLNLSEKCKKAEVLIVAAGSPHLVKSEWIRPGIVVIDIGINYDQDGRLIGGDVDFERVKDVAAYVTPVPGGIGPLTITSLAENVLKSALFHYNHHNDLVQK
jgi:methylenetetrahydrofolate dehydrogenase (NADP+) / methenyltetrahydrofolate cyclohydrolase